MSTREEHPIDEIFRRSLANAEATPPPSVWAGIQNARKPRRMLPWFRMNGILLLIIPGAALVTYLSWPPSADRSTSSDVAASTTAQHELVLADASAEDTSDDRITPTQGSIGRQEASAPIASEKEAEPLMNDQADQASFVPKADRPSEDPIGIEDPAENYGPTGTDRPEPASESSSPGIDPESLIGNEPTAEPSAGPIPDRIGTAQHYGAGSALFIRPLAITLQPQRSPGELRTAPLAPDYVLPNSEWIFSAIFARYDVKREWRGSDEELVKALNGTEARTSTFAFGASVGRQYRSGWGFSAGVLNERSEQQFDYLDKRTEVSQEVITFLVTLDSEVYVSNIDTVDHVSTTEQRYQGINKRNVIRIPLEGNYHRSLGRLQYGVRAGLALELTTTQQAASLTLDRQEDRVGVTQLSRSELVRRYPALLMGVAGVDLGYTLNEHWSAWANPLYMFSTTPIGSKGDAWSAPSRFGLQFRLSYHFIPKKK